MTFQSSSYNKSHLVIHPAFEQFLSRASVTVFILQHWSFSVQAHCRWLSRSTFLIRHVIEETWHVRHYALAVNPDTQTVLMVALSYQFWTRWASGESCLTGGRCAVGTFPFNSKPSAWWECEISCTIISIWIEKAEHKSYTESKRRCAGISHLLKNLPASKILHGLQSETVPSLQGVASHQLPCSTLRERNGDEVRYRSGRDQPQSFRLSSSEQPKLQLWVERAEVIVVNASLWHRLQENKACMPSTTHHFDVSWSLCERKYVP